MGGLAPCRARTAAITASADAMPLRETSFDVVLLTQVLEHVLRPAAVLTEIARVLRPGGTLFATVPFAWNCTRSRTTTGASRSTRSPPCSRTRALRST